MRPANSSVRLFPDTTLCEYELVACPDEALNLRIIEEKVFFYRQFDYGHAVRTQTHITIANFKAKEVMEATLVRWIQNICRLHSCFPVQLNNFNGFPTGMICIRVQDPNPFGQLAASLKMIDGFIQSNDCPPLQLVTRPHLTIARNLPGYIYEKAIKEYAGRCFTESFMVQKLALLKREVEFDKCELVNTFTLMNNR